MRSPTLWRINSSTPAQQPLALEALRTGLRRHLGAAWLVTCLVQIGERQQAYVGLEGCPGCLSSRCEAGCRVEALRRTLRAASSALTLSAVRRGLAERPYTRAVVALPTRRAEPLTGDLLQPWPEARLTITLRPGLLGASGLAAGATLHVGEGGPDPAATLQLRGWRAWRQWRLRAPDFPTTPSLRVRALPHAPWLLLPATAAAAPAPTTPDEAGSGDETGPLVEGALVAEQPEPHGAVASALSRVLAGETVFRPADAPGSARAAGARGSGRSGVIEAPGIWPVGPGQGNGAITPAVLEGLFKRLCGEPASEGADCATTGLTLRRLNLLLGDRHNEHSRAVLLWLDAAGLLDAPADPAQPWDSPRALATSDTATIATKLRETALPTPEAVEQAKLAIKK
jgi:hypothetical protein